ncbi:MAG: carbohydrate kinase family protein [Candidatus Thermoplasmatota archaeon]
MDKNLKNKLIEKLEKFRIEEISDSNIVMLPDFFVDHFLYLDDFEKEFERIKKIYGQGGGNAPGVNQDIRQGGNAANTSLALARLGVNVDLICRTSEFGKNLLDYFLGKHGVNLEKVKSDGELAVTTAMEFGEKHVNVMVGDTGSVADFSFDRLDEEDLEKISQSDIVGVMNWSLNRRGTDLAEKVFKYAKKRGVKTFFDTGDPAHRERDIPNLFENVISSKNLDIIGLNENELKHYTGYDVFKDQNELIDAAVSLKKRVSARVDLHTCDLSCSIKNEGEKFYIPAVTLSSIKRATGAGDSWNAGNLFGELAGLDDEERLLFANYFAACYISDTRILHPDLEEVIDFIRKNELKTIK